jgi:hypothetical protein
MACVPVDQAEVSPSRDLVMGEIEVRSTDLRPKVRVAVGILRNQSEALISPWPPNGVQTQEARAAGLLVNLPGGARVGQVLQFSLETVREGYVPGAREIHVRASRSVEVPAALAGGVVPGVEA